MKYWDIHLETPHGFTAGSTVGYNIQGETAQDALELWRLQHPRYWNCIDLKNRTLDGQAITITESDPNAPTSRIILI